MKARRVRCRLSIVNCTRGKQETEASRYTCSRRLRSRIAPTPNHLLDPHLLRMMIFRSSTLPSSALSALSSDNEPVTLQAALRPIVLTPDLDSTILSESVPGLSPSLSSPPTRNVAVFVSSDSLERREGSEPVRGRTTRFHLGC